MVRRFVDISMHLENDVVSDPPGFGPEIEYFNHKDTAADVVSYFPGLKVEDLPESEGWAIEKINLVTHNGTHLDAPYHFHSTMNKGERAITIDEVPLDWCFRPGVKLDFTTLEDGYVVTPEDVELTTSDETGITLNWTANTEALFQIEYKIRQYIVS